MLVNELRSWKSYRGFQELLSSGPICASSLPSSEQAYSHLPSDLRFAELSGLLGPGPYQGNVVIVGFRAQRKLPRIATLAAEDSDP
jgi:hypothetical protein